MKNSLTMFSECRGWSSASLNIFTWLDTYSTFCFRIITALVLSDIVRLFKENLWFIHGCWLAIEHTTKINSTTNSHRKPILRTQSLPHYSLKRLWTYHRSLNRYMWNQCDLGYNFVCNIKMNLNNIIVQFSNHNNGI